MAITGHTKMEEILTYTKAAEQKRLSQAAMTKMAVAFDQKVPNPPDGLGKIADKALKTLTAKGGMARPTGLEPVFPP